MRWSCEVCTFSNVNGTAPKCEICEIARSEAAEWTRTGKTNYTHQPKQNSNVDSASAVQQKRPVEQKSTVQATLFGGIVSKRPSTNPSQAKNKKSKVRSRVEVSAPCKQSTLLFDSKKSSTMFSDPPSTSNAPATHTNTIKLDLWKTTCPSNVSLDDLKQRTRLAMDSIFGVKKLRFLQPKAIRCALQRKCQLVIMATGGGTYTRATGSRLLLVHLGVDVDVDAYVCDHSSDVH